MVLQRYFYWINDVVWQGPTSYVVPVHFAIFVFGNLYMVALAFDALRTRNNLQLFGICIFNMGIFTFAVMRIGETHMISQTLPDNIAAGNKPFVKDVPFWSKVQPALIVNAIIPGVCMIASWLLTFRLNREFAWAIYRHISGSLSIRSKYLAYQVSLEPLIVKCRSDFVQVLLVVMKLEAYFVIAFIVVYGLIDVHYELPEFPLTIAIIPLLFIQMGMTIYFIKHENKLGALAAIVSPSRYQFIHSSKLTLRHRCSEWPRSHI